MFTCLTWKCLRIFGQLLLTEFCLFQLKLLRSSLPIGIYVKGYEDRMVSTCSVLTVLTNTSGEDVGFALYCIWWCDATYHRHSTVCVSYVTANLVIGLSNWISQKFPPLLHYESVQGSKHHKIVSCLVQTWSPAFTKWFEICCDSDTYAYWQLSLLDHQAHWVISLMFLQ